MWYAAGDTATDWNFYSKRALLAAVYSSTLLYWLNDRSEGFVDTWGFLDRRIGDVMRIPRATARMHDAFPFLPTPSRLFRSPRRLDVRGPGSASVYDRHPAAACKCTPSDTHRA